jgi:glucosamine kinase
MIRQSEETALVSYVIGIDGGGTGCRAAVADAAGNIRGHGRSGPANIMTDPDGARESVVEAARLACIDASIDPSVLETVPALLGLAGANIDAYGERIRAILPFREAIVETDALIALHGALGEHDGAVAILGTGSIFVARAGGTVRRVGGWGFMLGDLGSGARLGRALLQETLLAHDGVHPASALTNDVLSRFGGDPRRLVEYAHTAKPGEFGAFAPIVFDHAERGDPIAAALVDGALRSIEEALSAIMAPDCSRLCLLGGLAHKYESRLSERYRALVREPLGDALQGAVALAVSRFSARETARDG